MANDFVEKVKQEIKEKYQESQVAEICAEYEYREEMVPMRDGILLQTMIYQPKDGKDVHPVILQRTCYPFWDCTMRLHGENLAKRGYTFIYQYCRGKEKSQGEWEPNIHERQDGIDTVEWICAQPWAGRIGVWGSSYGALIGWAMADAVTDKVSAMCLGEYGCDRFVSAYQKGAFRHDVLTSWTMENAGFPIAADYLESCRFMPQELVDETLWGKQVPWYRDYILNDRQEDEYWQGGWWKQLREIPQKVEIPLYITSGWYDHHHGSTMVSWQRLKEETKAHSWLDVGAWNHFGLSVIGHQITDNNHRNDIKSMLEWFYLTLVLGEVPKGRIRMYEIGKDSWIWADSLEQLKTKEQYYYFSAAEGKKCLEKILPQKKSQVEYCYQPERPVMSHGAESMLKGMPKVGSLLQPEPDYRRDVVSFLSQPLEEALEIQGKIKIELYVTSDCEDTAFTGKVMEVHADNQAYNIRSSITTIGSDSKKGEPYRPGTPIKVVIEMWDIMYTLQAGSCLRVDISSSDFPQYNIHSNYPGNWAKQEKSRHAQQNILCGEGYPSRLILPTKDMH